MSMEETGRSLKAQELNRKIMATHGTWEDSVEDDIPDIIAKHVANLHREHAKRKRKNGDGQSDPTDK